MLRIVTGRAGSGKTDLVLGEIAAHAANGENGILLLVPEQYSFNAECELCRRAGNGISLSAEVMTFKGLARRVFAETGGAPPRIDDGGRLLAMYAAQCQTEGQLRVYGGRRSTDMTSKLLSAVTEFKSYCVKPSDLAVADDERGGLADKLHDLSLIYGAYDAILGGDLGDPADVLERLYERLCESGYLRGRRIYMDGFVGFMPAELKIIGRAAADARELTVTLCLDGEDGGSEDVFAHCRATLGELRRACGGTETRTERVGDGSCRRFSDPESQLSFLEKNLFEYAASGRDDAPDGSVRMFSAASRYSECEYAAAEIRKLVETEGYRYRDIAVVIPSSGFSDVLSVFSKYGIPCFADRTESIVSKAPVKAVCSAVDAAVNGFRMEDCLRLAKTGLAGLTPEEADDLEGYVRMWNINGKAWVSEPGFTMHPGGYGEKFSEETEAELASLNEKRRRFAMPLARLAQGLETGTARDMTAAVCTYMEETGFADNVAQRRGELRRTGNIRAAEEYSQLVEMIYGALEQFVSVMENEKLKPEEYAPLLRVMLSGCSVGTIPTTLDCVSVGEAERARFSHPRALFILCAVEGSFPPAPVEGGLLTSADRRELAGDRNIRLAPDDVEQVRRSQLTAYRTVAAPSDRLFVSCPKNGADGAQLSPSYVCTRIRKLLPGLAAETADEHRAEFRTWAPVPCAELGATVKSASVVSPLAWAAAEVSAATEQGRALLARAEFANSLKRGPIKDPEVVSGLYRERPSVTVSKLEMFNTCRFSFFARYGLGVESEKKAALEPQMIGTFVHYVLERTAKDISSRPGDPWGSVTKALAREIAEKYIEEYVREQMGGLSDKPARIRWLFERLCSRVFVMTDSLVDEFSVSDFRPVSFEYDFRGKVCRIGNAELPLSGQADRVDIWEKDGERYIRIADYKTGEKKFSYSDISAGLGIQLLLYLFVLEEEENAVPAGVLYVPSLRKVQKVDLGEEADACMGRSGIVLGDEEVLRAMERLEPGQLKARFIPVSYSAKDGTVKKESSVATKEQFETMKTHVGGVLGDMYSALKAGEMECTPYIRSSDSACDRCEYRQICQFDPNRRGDKYRVLPKVKREEFYERMGGDSGLDK